MKKILLVIVLIVFAFTFGSIFAKAQDSVQYSNDLILDSDLDGLTDEGEGTLFKTDPENPDTDGDGWYDGTEIINKIDPLDPTVPSATTVVSKNISSIQVPWAWYITRASGLIAFAFAWVVIFLGVAIRLPVLKKIVSPVYSLSAHHSLAFQTVFFSLLHGASLLFDRYLNLSFVEIFIPFQTEKLDPLSLSLGILAFYGFIILVLTSWLKPMIPQRIWRITHFMNALVYVFVIVHALLLGTDIAVPLFRNIFIGINIFLGILLVWNFILKLSTAIRHATEPASNSIPSSSNPDSRFS